MNGENEGWFPGQGKMEKINIVFSPPTYRPVGGCKIRFGVEGLGRGGSINDGGRGLYVTC